VERSETRGRDRRFSCPEGAEEKPAIDFPSPLRGEIVDITSTGFTRGYSRTPRWGVQDLAGAHTFAVKLGARGSVGRCSRHAQTSLITRQTGPLLISLAAEPSMPTRVLARIASAVWANRTCSEGNRLFRGKCYCLLNNK
jgi:hypothetical protein